MTSASNHQMTMDFITRRKLVERFKNHVCISFVTQALPMPCFKDTEGNLDFVLEDQKPVLTGKPHGHGDIHLLVKQSDILTKWAKNGVRSVCFFQDRSIFVDDCSSALRIYGQK